MANLKMNISKNKEMKEKKDLQIKYLMQESEMIATNLKLLEEREIELENSTERRNEDFKIEEEDIAWEKANLIGARQSNIEAIENLTKFEVNNNKGTRSNEESSKAVERLRGYIERKESVLQRRRKILNAPCAWRLPGSPSSCAVSSTSSAPAAPPRSSSVECPLCREELSRPLRKHRYAEKEAEEVASLREELEELKEELAEMQGEGEGDEE